MIERYLLILLAVILTGSVGAFFLYVAILPVIAVAAVLIGLAAMFGLGFYSARNPDAVSTAIKSRLNISAQ
jgi:hypothetical protein